jgi:hypothetical protein
MRTSLNNTNQIEDFLSGHMSQKDSFLFKAKMLIDPVLRMNVGMQRKTYSLIRLYGRKQLISEIEIVHQRIFQDPEKKNFCRGIEQLFSKS